MQANTNMADNNNKRKSRRNFSLEKPVERRFDIEKDVDVAPVAPAKPVPVKPGTGAQQKPDGNPQKPASKPQGKDVTPTTPTGGNNGGNGGDNGGDDGNSGNSSIKWIVIALIIAALAACACFYMSGNKSDEEIDPQPPLVEQNDSMPNDENATDSAANAAKESEGNANDCNSNDTDETTAADQNVDNMSEATSVPQSSETKQSTSTTNNQTVSNTPANLSGVSSQSQNGTSNSTIEQKAKDVWKGVYGNNPDRRRNLGEDYEAVQKLVNEMHRRRLN